jgi:hypothetical protein
MSDLSDMNLVLRCGMRWVLNVPTIVGAYSCYHIVAFYSPNRSCNMWALSILSIEMLNMERGDTKEKPYSWLQRVVLLVSHMLKFVYTARSYR